MNSFPVAKSLRTITFPTPGGSASIFVARKIFPRRLRSFAATTNRFCNDNAQIHLLRSHRKPNMKATTKPTKRSQKAMAASRGSQSSSKRVSPDVVKLAAPDLTQRPPRSPRSRLGGYSVLPRALDKARATLAGTHGEYHFNCPVDRHFLRFVGI